MNFQFIFIILFQFQFHKVFDFNTRVLRNNKRKIIQA